MPSTVVNTRAAVISQVAWPTLPSWQSGWGRSQHYTNNEGQAVLNIAGNPGIKPGMEVDPENTSSATHSPNEDQEPPKTEKEAAISQLASPKRHFPASSCPNKRV